MIHQTTRGRTLGLFLVFLFLPLLSNADSALKGHVIVIDAGHGTLNFQGKVINAGRRMKGRLPEYKLTLQIAAKVAELLRREGAKVYMTRTPANGWRRSYSASEDNRNRATYANDLDAEALISIHCDYDPRSSIRGVGTYYAKKNSHKLGKYIQRNLVKTLQTKNRKLVNDTYTILETAEVPAVLVESGFLSNRKEAKKLADPAYQAKIAKALANGLSQYFLSNQVASIPQK